MLAVAVATPGASGPTLAADDAGDTPAAATLEFPGSILGTVLWAGRSRFWFTGDACEVHEFDMEGHPGVETGLGNVVVVAQPLGRENQRWFREHPRDPDDDDHELDWDEYPSETVVAVPLGRPLIIKNEFGIDRELRVYRGRALFQTIEIGANDVQKVTLPEGIFRIADPAYRAKAWAYVTPYPAWVTGGNCRYAFSNLPSGRYRLTGWHPRAGTRSRTFPVGKRKVNYLTPLLFGASASDACVSEGFRCYGPAKPR